MTLTKEDIMGRIFFCLLFLLTFPLSLRAENIFAEKSFQKKLEANLHTYVLKSKYRTTKYHADVNFCTVPSVPLLNGQLLVFCGVTAYWHTDPLVKIGIMYRMGFKLSGKKPALYRTSVQPPISTFQDPSGLQNLLKQIDLMTETAARNAVPETPEPLAKAVKPAKRTKSGKPVNMTWQLETHCWRGKPNVVFYAGDEKIGEADLSDNNAGDLKLKCFSKEKVCMKASLGDTKWYRCEKCQKEFKLVLTCH